MDYSSSAEFPLHGNLIVRVQNLGSAAVSACSFLSRSWIQTSHVRIVTCYDSSLGMTRPNGSVSLSFN